MTCLHSLFALLCLKAQCLQHAEATIDHPVTAVMHGTNPVELLTYNYYRGLIFMGLEQFDKAIECFRKVLSQPVAMVH